MEAATARAFTVKSIEVSLEEALQHQVEHWLVGQRIVLNKDVVSISSVCTLTGDEGMWTTSMHNVGSDDWGWTYEPAVEGKSINNEHAVQLVKEAVDEVYQQLPYFEDMAEGVLDHWDNLEYMA